MRSATKTLGVDARLLLLLPVSLLIPCPLGNLVLLVTLFPEREVSMGAKLEDELLGSSSGDEGLEPVVFVEKVEDIEGEPMDPK